MREMFEIALCDVMACDGMTIFIIMVERFASHEICLLSIDIDVNMAKESYYCSATVKAFLNFD